MPIEYAKREWTRGGDKDQDGNKRYVESWLVKATTKATTIEEVYAALPQIGDVHPDNIDATLINVRPNCFKPLHWRAKLNYSTKGPEDNPLNDRVKIVWDSENRQIPIEEAVNSAGDPLDPPKMRDKTRRKVTITANVAVVPTWVVDFEDVVNDVGVTIDGYDFSARQVKVGIIKISDVRERNDIEYRTLTINIDVNKETWDFRILDQGFREKDGSDGMKHIKNEGDGQDVTAPVPLDGEGHALDSPTPATVVFLNLRDDDIKYDEEDLSVLPGVETT